MIALKKWFLTALGGGMAVVLLTRSALAAQGVRDGIDLCLTSVIPALFPFFAASQLLAVSGAAETLGRLLEPLFRRLLGVSGAGAAAFLLGLTGGYPVGAKTAESLVRQRLLTPEEGAALLTFCNNAGPAFVVGIAGNGVFHSPRAGIWLYLIHTVSAVMVGSLFAALRRCTSGGRRVSAAPSAVPAAQRLSVSGAFIGAVQGGVRAMAGVCGFVIFFLTALRLAESFLGSLPPLAAGAVELTNGILRLTADGTGFVTAAGLLGWGGLSVHCQTAAVVGGSGISLRWYLPAKAAQGLLSAALAAAVWRWAL